MVFRFRYITMALWVACTAGVVVIAALSFGWVSWTAFALAGVVGLAFGIPAAHFTHRRVTGKP